MQSFINYLTHLIFDVMYMYIPNDCVVEGAPKAGAAAGVPNKPVAGWAALPNRDVEEVLAPNTVGVALNPAVAGFPIVDKIA